MSSCPVCAICVCVCVSHSWIRQATACVECRQQSQAQVFGHVQEFVLVPLHVLTSFFQHHSHGMSSQKAAEHRQVSFRAPVQNPSQFSSTKTNAYSKALAKPATCLKRSTAQEKFTSQPLFKVQSHPRTRMLVSKTDTTMSLSSLTSESTLLTAASNSVVLFKSCQQKKHIRVNDLNLKKKKENLHFSSA